MSRWPPVHSHHPHHPLNDQTGNYNPYCYHPGYSEATTAAGPSKYHHPETSDATRIAVKSEEEERIPSSYFSSTAEGFLSDRRHHRHQPYHNRHQAYHTRQQQYHQQYPTHDFSGYPFTSLYNQYHHQQPYQTNNPVQSEIAGYSNNYLNPLHQPGYNHLGLGGYNTRRDTGCLSFCDNNPTETILDSTLSQLSTLDGVQCGVPTLTTPTLTPTTLKNIQQTFLQASSQLQPQPPEQHSNQAGFMPPVVHPQPGSTFISIDSKSLGGGIATIVDTSSLQLSDQTLSTSSTIIPSSSNSSGGSGPPPPLLPIAGLATSHAVPIPGPTAATSSVTSSALSLSRESEAESSTMPGVSITVTNPHAVTSKINLNVPPTRRMGGRRPIKDEHLTVEEEAKKMVRRERNKMAAARCRKRRLDQTMTLQEETDLLESKKNDLQSEIQILKQQKDELEFLLKHHKRDCNLNSGSKPNSIVVVTSSNASQSHSFSSHVLNRNSNHIITKRIKKVHTSVPSHNNMSSLRPPSVTVKEELFSDSEEYVAPEIPISYSSLANRIPVSSRTPLLISANSHATSGPKIVTVHASKPNRPTTLNVAPLTDIGVSIETPSSGIRGLNFESMMDGGTGLTPVTPLAGSMVSLATGLTPLTTPIISHPSASVSSSLLVSSVQGINGLQQVNLGSGLNSPDSGGAKHLVSL